MRSLFALLLAACLSLETTSGFIVRDGSRRISLHSPLSASPAPTSTTISIETVYGGPDDPRVLDVASFRNGVVNPQMMVERAQAKRDAVDTKTDALKGLKIGLLYVGPAIAALTYADSGDVGSAVTNYAVIGGGVGALLAINNFLGKGVHVPDIPEATNRITVDFSEGLLRQQDVGFVAIDNNNDDTFRPSHGVMGTVDVQLRNSPNSRPGVRQVSAVGVPHVHLKNMLVHETMRRKGVGRALVEAVAEYAKKETDAKMLTLEADGKNTAALNLYKGMGFTERENPNKLSVNVFMTKEM